MDVSIRTYGNLRDVVGKDVTVTLSEGATVADALEAIGSGADDDRADFVLVNGRSIFQLDGYSTRLSPGDSLAVGPEIVPE